MLFPVFLLYCFNLETVSGGGWGYDLIVLNVTISMDDQMYARAADFLFEVGVLAKTPRSGIYFLGEGRQSVAEHLNRAAYIGFVLGQMAGSVNTAKIVQMCLFHDLLETRVSDLNYVHQQYVSIDVVSVWDDILSPVSFGGAIQVLMDEYHARQTLESIIAKDADNLEWIITLKEIYDIGNTRVLATIENAQLRLKSPAAQRLATAIMAGKSDQWYNSTKPKQWWVARKR